MALAYLAYHARRLEQLDFGTAENDVLICRRHKGRKLLNRRSMLRDPNVENFDGERYDLSSAGR